MAKVLSYSCSSPKMGATSVPVKGYKDGGEVLPAARIDGNKFVLAAQKVGLSTDTRTLNKLVNLVNQGHSVDSAAEQVAMSSEKGR
jgi:hypothetical protein